MPRARRLKPIRTLADLTPDPVNAREHTPRNVGTIVDALQTVGAARSIVIDEGGVVLAGNATIEAAAEAGITRVQVVDADGATLVAVRRTGLSKADKTRLALFDNRAAELAAGWKPDVLASIRETDVKLDDLFTDAELDRLTARAEAVQEVDEPDEAIRFNISTTLVFADLDQQQAWYDLLRKWRTLYGDLPTGDLIVRANRATLADG